MEEEPWEKRSRIALRSSALASNHRGGNGLAALKMYVKLAYCARYRRDLLG